MSYSPVPRINTIPADDTSSVGVPVRALPQRLERIGFTKAISNNVDSDWVAIVGSIGGGMTVNQTGGNLVITAGTTARSETIIRSNGSWEGGIRLRARTTLSQRIVNNNFFVELVDVIGDGLSYTITSATAMTVTIPSNPFTAENVGQSVYIGGFSGTGTFVSGRYAIASVAGNNVTFTVAGFAAGSGTCSIFGWNYYQMLYTGTTVTNMSFQTQRRGYANAAITATINTTTSPGHLAILSANDAIASLSDQLTASATAIQTTQRANQVENIPDDVPLRIQIRCQNGTTAPASSTTWTIGFVSISNFSAQDISVQDIRPMNVGTGVPVEIVRGVALATQPVSGTVTANIGTGSIAAGANAIGDVGVQYRANATGAGTPTILNSPATPAVQTVKGSAGRLLGVYVMNSNAAARFLKVFNLVTPTLGTSSATLDIPIPPTNNPIFISFEGGIAFGTAITVAITGGRGATDNTAITLNDCTGFTLHA